MFSYTVKSGSVDTSVVIRIVDSVDGTPETGVVFNTAGIDIQYRREGEDSTAITEATLAGLTTAHIDGGFLHIGNGYYRVDLPDAAIAAGATGVLVHGTVTGMIVIGCYIHLVAYDPLDTVRFGLTSLPNAAAGSNGGLPTVDATNSVKIQTIAKKNQARANFPFLMTDSTNHNPAPGKTVAVTRAIDNGVQSAGTLSAVTEIANGMYRVDFAAADMNGNQVTLRATASGCDDLFVTFDLEP